MLRIRPNAAYVTIDMSVPRPTGRVGADALLVTFTVLTSWTTTCKSATFRTRA